MIPPVSKISRLFIHIAIFWLAYELNTILGLFIHSFIIDDTGDEKPMGGDERVIREGQRVMEQ